MTKSQGVFDPPTGVIPAQAGTQRLRRSSHWIPARAGTDLLPETVARLAALPGIAGIVDATGDLASFSAIGRAAGPGFLLLSGDDATAAAHGAMGGQGCVSVVANLVPGPCAALQRAIRAGST